jgi:hypothetical protein
VSTSNPLPEGISARKVAADFVEDDLIENAAIERKDAGLLTYAASGNALLAEQQEITADSSGDIMVLSIRDAVANIQLGSKADPNNPSADIAVIVEGQETRQQHAGKAAVSRMTHHFDLLLWLVWSPAQSRYLLCDTATA